MKRRWGSSQKMKSKKGFLLKQEGRREESIEVVATTWPAIAFSKLTIETIKQDMKYVQG